MSNKNIDNLLINEMLEDSKNMFFRNRKEDITNIKLIDDATILYDTVNKNNNFLTYVPYDFESEKLHGNYRNRIAKLFVDTITIEDIYNKYIDFLKEKEEEENIYKNKYIKLEELFQKIKQYFTIGSVELKQFTMSPEIEYNYRLNFRSDRYKSYSEKLTIKFDNDEYKIKRMYLKENGLTYNYEEITIKENIEELIKLINNMMQAINIKIAEEQELLNIYKQEQEKYNKLVNFVNEAIKSKDKITVLKNKKSYIAISYYVKWACGEGKQGKYSKAETSKIIKLIQDKNITEYLQFDRNDDVMIDLSKYEFNQIV